MCLRERSVGMRLGCDTTVRPRERQQCFLYGCSLTSHGLSAYTQVLYPRDLDLIGPGRPPWRAPMQTTLRGHHCGYTSHWLRILHTQPHTPSLTFLPSYKGIPKTSKTSTFPANLAPATGAHTLSASFQPRLFDSSGFFRNGKLGCGGKMG